jgi:CRP-like cAMP-binding protein
MKKYYLILEKGLLPKSIYPLEGSVAIGRGPDNGIRLVDRMASRSHARLLFEDGAWIIEDLGSANGVIFAGQRLDRQALKPGDTFQIGETSFRFIKEEIPEGGAEPFHPLDTFAATIMAHTPLPDRARTASGSFEAALLATPLLSSLSGTERRRLVEAANLHLVSPGETIIREGDPGRSLYIVLDGRVRVFTRDYQGGELQLSILGPDQFFGEASLLTGRPRTGSVVALEETLLSEFSFVSARRLVLRFPRFRDIIITHHLERLQDLKNKRAAAGALERRRHPRRRERPPLKGTISPTPEFSEAAAARISQATSVEISLGGVLVEVEDLEPRAMVPGSRLRLTIELPSPWGEIHTEIIVSHLRPGSQSSSLAGEFVGLTDTDRNRLEDFLYGEVIVAL